MSGVSSITFEICRDSKVFLSPRTSNGFGAELFQYCLQVSKYAAWRRSVEKEFTRYTGKYLCWSRLRPATLQKKESERGIFL